MQHCQFYFIHIGDVSVNKHLKFKHQILATLNYNFAVIYRTHP